MSPSPTRITTERHSDHVVTIEADAWHPTASRMTCYAPDDALCHAVWSCDCEEMWDQSVRNGMPAHRPDYEDQGTWHAGKFESEECNLREWFENGDEALRGEIRVPVTASWEGDFYLFHMQQQVRICSTLGPNCTGCPDCQAGSAIDLGEDNPAAPPVSDTAAPTITRVRESVCNAYGSHDLAGYEDESRCRAIADAVLAALGLTVTDKADQ